MQALALNLTRCQERLTPRMPGLREGFAVADMRGVLYRSDSVFDELMRQESPGSPPDKLPANLLHRLLAGETQFVGRMLVLRRHVEHGLLFLRTRARCRADALTPRELEIARRVADGRTHKEIAQTLARSPATVRNQIQAIHAKLQVGTVAGLIEAIRPVR